MTLRYRPDKGSSQALRLAVTGRIVREVRGGSRAADLEGEGQIPVAVADVGGGEATLLVRAPDAAVLRIEESYQGTLDDPVRSRKLRTGWRVLLEEEATARAQR